MFVLKLDKVHTYSCHSISSNVSNNLCKVQYLYLLTKLELKLEFRVENGELEGT
jgi:hypothetical protein